MLNSLLSETRDVFNNRNILITGGTGSFGKEMTKNLLAHFTPKKILIFSRDEFKQYQMKKEFGGNERLRFILGDIRDPESIVNASIQVDILIHTAALKQVDAIEENPSEAIKTNIYGTENVIKAAIKNQVSRVIAISTDKCVNPINLYGATKLCLEKLIIHANSRQERTKFCVMRYGNVMNSRGSVIPLFKSQSKQNIYTVTDEKMTRFTITLLQAVNFVLNSASKMIGGEIFVAKLPTYNVLQLVKCFDKDPQIKYIGMRAGEKIHECLLSSSESKHTIENDDFYIIIPGGYQQAYFAHYGNKLLEKEMDYTSCSLDRMSNSELMSLIDL